MKKITITACQALSAVRTSMNRVGRIGAILLLCVASVGLAFFASHAQNPPGTFLVFGPANYVRERGAPVPVTNNFTAHPGADYVLRIFNGGRDNQYRTTSRAAVWLNGVKIVRPRDFNQRFDDRDDNDDRDDGRDDNDTRQNVRVIEKRVTLAAGNTLVVKLRGARGSGITLEIVGIDRDPPTITATSAPFPNAAGWNNTDTTVSFTCTDSTSGIATCPMPVTLTSEGANQLVSGTATDRAGNSASTSVTVNLDKTPPNLSALSNPAPNAGGWNNTDVTVSFNATDALSGIVDATAPVTVTTEGGNQTITGTATDRAGNSATANAQVNIDKTPPAISITSPTDGATVNASSVTVTGVVSDLLSGVASVNCGAAPASVSGSTFSCNVTLAEGPNAIDVRASDVAGNESAAVVNVTQSGTSVTIGPGGGTLASADGRVRLDFPPGAVAADTVITAVPRTVPTAGGFVGNLVYELGPDGIVFARPVRLTLAYDPAALSVPEATLRIGKLIEGGVGEFAGDPMVDTTRHTVAGSLSGFSGYGVTGSPSVFSLRAEPQGDRSIRVSWTSAGGSLSVERATCIFPQVCGNPAPIQPPDSSFGFFASGASGDVRDTNLPAVGAIFWYRIRNATHVFATQYVVIFGLPTPPGPPTGFTATPAPDGDILLTWDPSAETDVSFVITREVCGAETFLTELPAQATSFTDDRSFGLAPGAQYTYRLSRRNRAGASSTVSATATSTVGPAECQTFTISVTSCDIAVPSGGSATVEVQIQRAGGSPLDVTLSLEPLGNFNVVLDHSFAPETSSDGNSILTLTDLGGSDRVSAIIRGRDVVTGASCFTPISVHFTGNAVPVTLTTYEGRTPTNALWAVRRLGDGPWERISGASGRYEFTASSAFGGRYSVAVACNETAMTILELTTSETSAPVVRCPATNATNHLVQGAFQNLPANHCVRGAVGERTFPSCFTQSYLASVPAGTYDIVATLHPFIGGGQSANAPDAFRIVRDLVVTGPTDYPLDLAGAIAATPGLVQVTPLATSSAVYLRTANRVRAVVGQGAFNATQFSFGGLPFASQATGDIHELSMNRGGETRHIFFRTPADQLVDFSNPLAWSSTTLSNAASSSHRRITLTADRVAGVSGYEIAFVSFDPFMEIDPPRRWTSFVSTGWLDASGLGSPFAYTTADLGSAPGFDMRWGLHTRPGSPTSYTITAHIGSGTLTTLLQLIAGDYRSVTHGYVWRSAARSGNVP